MLMSWGQKASARALARTATGSTSVQPFEQPQVARKSSIPGLTVGTTFSAGQLDGILADLHKEATSGFTGLDGIMLFDAKLRELQERVEDPKVVMRRRFTLAMGGVIFLNAIVISIEVDYAPRGHVAIGDRMGWFLLDSSFIVLYILEVCIKIKWERWRWPRNVWNWFDVIIVALAVLDVWILSAIGDSVKLQMLTAFRLVRLTRLARTVKMFRAFHGLLVMVMAFSRAVGSMLWIGVLLGMGLLLTGTVSTIIIGRNETFQDVIISGESVQARFGTVPRSMYSLFELMTLEGLDRTARPLVMKQPAMFIPIVLFIGTFTFGLLNMAVAVVVGKTLEETRNLQATNDLEARIGFANELMDLRTVFVEADADKDGVITMEEFVDILENNAVVVQILENLGVPVADVRELFAVLDHDDSGTVTISEFLEGCAKVKGLFTSEWDVSATHAGVRGLLRYMRTLGSNVKELTAGQASFRAEMSQRMAQQEERLQRLILATETAAQPSDRRVPKEACASDASATVQGMLKGTQGGLMNTLT